ncbi:MAG TPA: M56 family metallopeptidase [Sedimentisphaerales bacterium]|nr:M56 family metallopeptidase [Sedimentisphaerales bacterium]
MAETINRIAGVWFEWQWAMLWQTAVLIGLVAVIDRLIRNRAWPQLRYMLWLLVFVKLVLPPGLASPLSVTSRVPALAHQAVEARMQTPLAPAEPAAMAAAQTPSIMEPLAADPPRTVAVQDPPAPMRSGPLSWTACAMAVWLVGVVALGLGLHIRLRRLSREHAASRPTDAPAWFDDLLAQTVRELGLRRAPQVVFSDKVCCPAVFGVLRPVLLFPTDRLPVTRQETRHILLHELAHIKRGDLLVHAGYMILATVYWINPLLWLIRKHVQNLRELCCDATVAAHLREETAGYRETLLATGRALLARPIDPGLGLLGLFENSGWLPIRLQWLQKKTWRYPWLRRTSVAAVAILMLCCILPMASIHAANEKQSDQSFKVALPGGGTIDLIGVRKTDANDWWRPDGGPLPESPYDFSEETYRSDLYEFALRYENLPKGSSGGIDIERHLCGGTIPMWYRQVQKAGKPVEGMTYVIVGPEPGTETTMLAVYLATGDWTTDHFYPRMSDGWHDGVHSSSTLGAVAFAMPYEKDGRTYATVFHTASDPHQQDVRLTALDIANVEHPPAFQNGGWSAAGLATASSEFDLPLEDIAGFNLQRRPYTRIEFKNVSLHPGKRQKLEIVTIPASQPAVAEAKEEAKVPEGFSSFRDFSSQTLQAFHLACVGYLREHPDSDLPKGPWSLKFRLPKQVFFDGHYQDVRIAPVEYVTQAGYFRPGGFPSLKREDFDSSEAKRTPILYCKMLLEREDGKGTNVLFGDGRVEYVTAAELDRLKAADR